jgi:hypothetical protein
MQCENKKLEPLGTVTREQLDTYLLLYGVAGAEKQFHSEESHGYEKIIFNFEVATASSQALNPNAFTMKSLIASPSRGWNACGIGSLPGHQQHQRRQVRMIIINTITQSAWSHTSEQSSWR